MKFKFCVYCGAASVYVGCGMQFSTGLKITTMHCNRCNVDYHVLGDSE